MFTRPTLKDWLVALMATFFMVVAMGLPQIVIGEQGMDIQTTECGAPIIDPQERRPLSGNIGAKPFNDDMEENDSGNAGKY